MSLNVFSLVAIALISAVSAQLPVDPEEALFIYSRCMEDHLPDDASRTKIFLGWKDWNLVPEDKEYTQCYVKCSLTKMGLYDPTSKKFNADGIKKQGAAYKDLADESSVNKLAEAFKSLPQTDDNCKKVFDTYNKVDKQHKTTVRNIFHGNLELAKKLYEKLGNSIRQPKQSYFEYCENKNYPVNSANRKQLCQVRQYAILEDETFNKQTECIFKGLRYITKDNKLDKSEIKRDFKQANKDDSKVDEVLDKCGEPKNASAAAVHYYKCLLQPSIAADFKEAFDYREIRSQNYGYHLREKQTYSKPTIAAQVLEVDGKQCPKS